MGVGLDDHLGAVWGLHVDQAVVHGLYLAHEQHLLVDVVFELGEAHTGEGVVAVHDGC